MLYPAITNNSMLSTRSSKRQRELTSETTQIQRIKSVFLTKPCFELVILVCVKVTVAFL